MSFWSLLLLGVGLSADAFAASITEGLRMRKLDYRRALLIAGIFAGFQMLMPLIGWSLASQFSRVLAPIDHWIAFGLLVLIGGKMIWEAVSSASEDDEQSTNGTFELRRMLLLGLATSIDAAAVGVSLAFLNVSLVQAVLIIGVTTLVLSFVGIVVGSRVGSRFRRPAEFIGGLVLVLIGVRILLDHLGVFGGSALGLA